ncbi:hypothetical protein CDAR_370151, partial [Caerostris darwini]
TDIGEEEKGRRYDISGDVVLENQWICRITKELLGEGEEEKGEEIRHQWRCRVGEPVDMSYYKRVIREGEEEKWIEEIRHQWRCRVGEPVDMSYYKRVIREGLL